ncbi:PLP-dependent aminotransferase family protein [Streptomyces armeniacus]|uniref:PLP-dependent aminotransferase family protein n=1 Tax=Streptomyces armeniacus TaxID=83291 RepID=A0A345XMQ2_9ACTN|nr:PLP-dependent aminotransferase family protein [Streptomyces armeniacus]AXK32918.1 PLP-dependent aminotransferase family protein [Streptomyces armeniacus]
MASSWATSQSEGRPAPVSVSGTDLHLDLDRGPGGTPVRGLRAALMRALRDAVRNGRLAPGTRLPSSRSLAADLGVARNTVADAYAELVAEGWLTARQGSGTRVARRTAAQPVRRAAPGRSTARGPSSDPERRGPYGPYGPLDGTGPPRHDLRTGRPDLSSFPRAAWLTSARRALNAAPNSAFGYGDPRGRPELRRALADYLARARGVRADPARIVVCAGFSQALAMLGRTDHTARYGVAVESYGLWIHRDILTGAGVRTPPLAVDGQGARVADLHGSPVRAVLLTPAHQYPTGAPLLPDRRTEVVDWARTVGGLVLEDDYDGEFRYDRQPVGAVQGLDPERVVYLGTVSKSLAPGLRLGWAVLPGHVVDAVLAAKAEHQSSALDQLTLADLLESGAYDRHVRAVRLRYRRRRDQLVATLAERAPHIRVTGIAAGLHAVLELPPGTEQSVLRAAARVGLAVDGLSRFRHPDAAGVDGAVRDALVVGYGTPPDHAFPSSLTALCASLPP